MSIKAISWAWTQQVKASEKLVLLAIADSADDFGEAKLSQGYLMWKTEFSERFVRKALRELESAGVVSRVRTIRRDGTRGVDTVVLHLDKESSKPDWTGLSEAQKQLRKQVAERGIAAGEDFGPDLIPEAAKDEAPSQSHRHVVPVDGAEPVDKYVSPSQDHRHVVPVGGSYRHVVPVPPARGAGSPPREHLPTTRAHVFYPSSSSVGAAAPVDNDDDETTTIDGQSSDTAGEVASIHRGVNLTRLAVECSSAAGQWPVEVWAAAVDVILGRAKSRVARPQRYVTGSITNEPAVMADAAEVVAGADAALGQALWAGAGASSQGPVAVAARRVTCPIHLTDHREDRECAGCRADRIAQRPEEG